MARAVRSGACSFAARQATTSFPSCSRCPASPSFDKPGYGAFTNTDLEGILRNRGIERLIVCGVTTEVCVHSTLREAIDRGYRCILVGDACASADAELHAAALRMVGVEGGIFGQVLDTEATLTLIAAKAAP